jgi:hypothetical protein
MGASPDTSAKGGLYPLSKKANSKIVELSDIRPIVIKPHLVKICEKAISNKIRGDEIKNTGDWVILGRFQRRAINT